MGAFWPLFGLEPEDSVPATKKQACDSALIKQPLQLVWGGPHAVVAEEGLLEFTVAATILLSQA